MYRPFLFFVMFFIPGIVLGNFVKASWIFIVISIVSLIMGMFTQNKTRSVLFGILILFFGAFYYNFMFNRMAGTIATFADKQQTLVGVISDAPTVKKDQITYDVKALYLLEDEEYKGITGKVRLSSLLDDKSTTYRYGDVIKFSGKLKIPQGQRNPNGIDYKAYLMQKGISTTIFSREIRF